MVIDMERPGLNLYSKTIPTNKYEYVKDGAIEDRDRHKTEEAL